MSLDIIPVDALKSQIDSYSDPALSFEAEAAWKANSAFAKETRNYESLVNCFQGWILQRRRTTELIKSILPDPGSFYGNQHAAGHYGVTRLMDFGFSKQQWHRRIREMDIAEGSIDSYLDDCIEKSIIPSMHGLLNYALGSTGSRSGPNRYAIARAVYDEYRLDRWAGDFESYLNKMEGV